MINKKNFPLRFYLSYTFDISKISMAMVCLIFLLSFFFPHLPSTFEFRWESVLEWFSSDGGSANKENTHSISSYRSRNSLNLYLANNWEYQKMNLQFHQANRNFKMILSYPFWMLRAPHRHRYNCCHWYCLIITLERKAKMVMKRTFGGGGGGKVTMQN